MAGPTRQRLPWKRFVGEFLVIFAGVTVSLAADDWNSRRQDRLAEEVLLRELAAELATDSVDMAVKLADSEGDDRAALWLLQRWDEPRTDVDSIAARFLALTYLNFYQPVRATYTGLREAGRLTLIQDEGIRRDVVRYYEMRQPYILQFTESYGTSLYHPLQSAMVGHVRRRIDPAATSLRGGSLELELIESWAQITEDEVLRHRIHASGVHAATAALRLRTVIGENSDLRVRIAEAIVR